MSKSDDLMFTSVNESPPERVDLKELTEISARFRKMFVIGFEGVPIRVDSDLKDCEYYIAVSQDLYERIEDKYQKRNDNVSG